MKLVHLQWSKIPDFEFCKLEKLTTSNGFLFELEFDSIHIA